MNLYECLVFNYRVTASHQRCSIKKGVLKNLAKFTGKHLRQSLFLNKKRPATLLKKETLAQVFSCEFCKIFENNFLQNASGRTASAVSNCLCFDRTKLFSVLKNSAAKSFQLYIWTQLWTYYWNCFMVVRCSVQISPSFFI